MAYNVTEDFLNKIYSGDTEYNGRLYINNNLIPAEQISSIKISSPIIDTTTETGSMFHIGTFVSQALEIQFRNLDGINLLNNPEIRLEIGLKVGNSFEYVPIGKYIIDDLKENYQTTCTITCLDYAVKFKSELNISQFFDEDDKIYASDLFEAICGYYGVNVGTYPNVNNNKEITMYDSTISGKQYIMYLAELFGGYAKIDRNGNCSIYPCKSNSTRTINALTSKSFKIGDTYHLSRVCFDNGIVKYQAGGNVIKVDELPNTDIDINSYYYLTSDMKYHKYVNNSWQIDTTLKNTLYIRTDNLFITDQSDIDNIYNAVKDLEITNLTCENRMDISSDCWDIVTIQVDNKTYNTYYDNTITFNGVCMGTLKTEIPLKIKEETTNIVGGSPETKIRRIQTIVNGNTAELRILSEEVGEYDERITNAEEQVQYNTDEIAAMGKTSTSEGYPLEINASNNPTKIEIYGNTIQNGTPTPTNPIRIRNVGDNINLINNIETTVTKTGIEYKVNEDKSVLVNGTATALTTLNIIGSNSFVLHKGKYTLSGCPSGGSDTTYRIDINSGTYIDYGNGTTFTLDSDLTITNIRIRIPSGATVENLLFKPKLEQCSISTPYTKYNQGSVDIIIENEDRTEQKQLYFPFAEGQLLHKGDYLVEDGIHKKKTTVIFNGTESWSIDTAGGFNRFRTPITNGNSDTKRDIITSSHFKYGPTGVNQVGIGFTYSNHIYLYPTTDITTVEEFKEWLSNNNVYVEYTLKEEELIPYTPSQQEVIHNLNTFKGKNYIYCIDEILPEKLKITYYPNLPINDLLVNKDELTRVTEELNSEFNIKADSITSTVTQSIETSTSELLKNNYLTSEQVLALTEGNAEDIGILKSQVEQKVTAEEVQISITKSLEDGVSYVKNTLVEIDEDGMHISKSENPFSADYTNEGMTIKSYNNTVAEFNNKGATITGNLNIRNEVETPNLRIMNVSNHTYIHWIGG